MNPSIDDPERMCADYVHELPLIPGAFQIHQRPAGQLPDWGRRRPAQQQPQRVEPIVTRQTIERLSLVRQSTPNMVPEDCIDASVELLLQSDEQSQASKKSSSRFALLTKKLGKRHRDESRFHLFAKLRKKLRRSSPRGSCNGDVILDESSAPTEANSMIEHDSSLDFNASAPSIAPTIPLPNIPSDVMVSLASSRGSVTNDNATENSVIQVMEIFPDANRELVEDMLCRGNSSESVLCFLAEQSEQVEVEPTRPSIAGAPQEQEESRASRIMEVFPGASEDTVRQLLESGESVDQVVEDLALNLSASTRLTNG